MNLYLRIFISLITSEFIIHDVLGENSTPMFSWKCDKGKCLKKIASNLPIAEITSFNVCMLFCGPSIVWPRPTEYTVKGTPAHITTFSVELSEITKRFSTKNLEKLISGATDVFKTRIEREKSQALKPLEPTGTHTLRIELDIIDVSHNMLFLSTDESYSLTILQRDNTILADIKGETFFGIRHGLETLAQLIVYDNMRNGLVMPTSVTVNDEPQYPYRGILLDTSRNYFSVDSIKRTLDVMAANKLNRFHWHITDTQSFPLMLNNFQQFADYGAYSPKKIYTEKDVKSLIDYALIRGIRIIPELDAPAHTGEGWQWAPAGTILCLNKEPWQSYCLQPPCGQLNPLGEYVYNILGEMYKDYTRLFKPDIFHMGGDEVHFGCWETSEDIQKWLKDEYPKQIIQVEETNELKQNSKREDSSTSQKDGYFALWRMFQEKALLKLMEANIDRDYKPEVVLWTSDLTNARNLKYLNNSYIIQVWTPQHDKMIDGLLDNDFRIILSNYDALYFDSGFGHYTGKESTSIYRPWHTVYENMPFKIKSLPEEKKHLVLGQEAAMWSEMVSEGSLDAKVWPRAAALAERVWTNPDTSWEVAESRMLYNRERIVRLGVDADAIEPEWCLLNRGGCS